MLHLHVANIKVENQVSHNIEIRRGVRQGSILSLIYIKTNFHEASERILAIGIILNNIRYADDTGLLAEPAEKPQHLLLNLNVRRDICCIRSNIKRNNYMIGSKNSNLDILFQTCGDW